MSQPPCLPIEPQPTSKNKNKKRKFRGGHGRQREDDETITGGSSAAAGDEEIIFDGIDAMDATEYLRRVSKQAKKLPDFFVVGDNNDDQQQEGPSKRQRQFIPIDGSAASLEYLLSTRSALTIAPSSQYLPKLPGEFVESTLESFKNLRCYLNECWTNGVGGKQTNRIKLPPMKDCTGWNLFCGIDTQNSDDSNNTQHGQENKDQEEDDGKSPPLPTTMDDTPEWQQNLPDMGFYKPTTRLLLQMDQVLIRKILAHLVYSYAATTSTSGALTKQRCSWFYSLLARLEKPVHREDACVLFRLLKKLTIARSQLDMNDNKNAAKEDELAKFNCLIVIVGIYFEQGGTSVMKCNEE